MLVSLPVLAIDYLPPVSLLLQQILSSVQLENGPTLFTLLCSIPPVVC